MFADPLEEFLAMDRKKQKEIESLPVCDCCGEPIIEEFAWFINDQWFCDQCAEDQFRREVIPEYE